jgi:hypothetical protein
VNHSRNFIDPLSGAHTQKIERQWKTLKLQLLKQGSGVAGRTIDTQLSKFWWLSLHGRHVCRDPFLHLVDLIAKHYQH